MELTNGVLKSIDSLLNTEYNNQHEYYVCKYKGKLICGSINKSVFKGIGPAKSFLNKVIKNMFWYGEYYQANSSRYKEIYNYDVDFSETISILPSHGLTERFDSLETKKMIKDLVKKLLDEEIITIEKI